MVKKIKLGIWVLCLLAMSWVSSCEALEMPSDLPSAIKLLSDFPSKIENLEILLDFFDEIPGNQFLKGDPWNSVSSPNNPFPNPHPVISDKIPKTSDEAIFDFRRATGNDFIKHAGSADGLLTRSQFQSLVSKGKMPVKEDPDEYYQTHDKDGDGKLSIWEFVPSTQEVAKKHDLDILTTAFVQGGPYPNGNYPVNAPVAPTPGRVFISKAEIEQRITKFANSTGNTTTRAPDGKLVVIDHNGGQIPLPPHLIPPPLPLVVEKLREFAQSIGGTTMKGPGGMPLVKSADGKDVPPSNWPAPLRPPYLPPPEGAPPPGN